MMRCAAFIAALLVAGGAPSGGARADEPSLKDVLRRMGTYVQAYAEKASIVVATERYAQHVAGSGRTEPQARATVADFAIVRAEGLGGWIGFRDVVEVDGERMTDHHDRLIQILTASSGSFDEAKRLSSESARFNLGPILRDFNVPTSALFFFRAGTVDRFRFTRRTVSPEGVWEIGFRETLRPTLIRTPLGDSVPSEGSLWVNASTGTVLQTRMRMTEFGARGKPKASESTSAEIEVTYGLVPALDMWLPQTMTESYEVVRGTSWERTTTEAKYSEYRVFQTSIRIK